MLRRSFSNLINSVPATPSRVNFLEKKLGLNSLRKVTTSVALKQQDLADGSLKKVEGEERVFPSPFPDVQIPQGVTFTERVFDFVEPFAGQTGMVCYETGESFSFADIREKSFRVGSALTRLGYRKGDVLGIISPNCPEYALAFLGMAAVGIIPSTFNFTSSADEIRFQLVNSDCVGVICHEEKLPMVKQACQGNEAIRHFITIGREQDGLLSIYSLLKDDGKGLPQNVNINPGEDVLVLPYSSGTTGLPKGVMLTHGNILANLQQMLYPAIRLLTNENGKQNVVIGVLPMYHIFGMVINMVLCLATGSSLITMKAFHKNKYVDAIKRHKATVLPTVPPLMSFLESSDLATPEALQSVRRIVVGAAPVGKTLIENFRTKFGTGIQFFEGYGMTEASPLTHATPVNGFVVGSCGKTVSNTTIKILDPNTGGTMGRNEEGELCVKGPQVMKGYLKNEKATKETIIDGWLHTGDVARIDDNDYVYIVDRLKELIKVKGLQVAPAELENVLREHSAVEDVAVLGIPDDRAGEVPRAYVVLAKDPENNMAPDDVTKKAIQEFVSKRVAKYKRIASVVFIEEIPKSPSGKILRKELRKIAT